MKRDQRKPLKSFSLRVNRNARIDLHLKEGLFEKSNHASFITLSIYREGSQMPIHMTRPWLRN
jgi:hypothetical protein